MEFIHLILILVISLLTAGCLCLLGLARQLSKLKRENQKLLESWRLQNDYMDHIFSLCSEASSFTRQLRALASPEEAASSRTELEEDCLSRCGDFISNFQTENTVTDALLHSKAVLCRKEKVSFEAELRDLPSGFLTEIELVALLGNLLDNAARAAAEAGSGSASREAPFVRVRGFSKKGAWILKVENSKSALAAPLKNNMASTKKEAAGHGLGMEIIREITGKHGGLLEMEDLGTSFRTTVSFLLG